MNRKLKILLIFMGVILVGALFATAGAYYVFFQKANNTASLDQLYSHLESGAIPDEPPAFLEHVAKLEKAQQVIVTPGVYENTISTNGVIFNTVMVLNKDGTYNTAMSVGNGSIHRSYSHSGKWWVEGAVHKTVMLEGDEFLAAPMARDKKTPMNELIVDSGPDHITLLAHFVPDPVRFDLKEKAKTAANEEVVQ